ncbi:hypothetical protein C8R46DRAFT_1215117 [Mycena filopes]|nr:hypothetical protein C8R46DRAFT_1215117 [Mycena filopes]
MCGHIAIAFLSLCFAASTLAVPPPLKCPLATQGCSKCVATQGCSFVASYGSTLVDNCQPAATAALAPASALYTTAAQCTAFTNAVTQWNGIKSHVLMGDLVTKDGATPTSGRHLLSNFNTKNGATLSTQLRNVGNVNTATKIMSILLPPKNTAKTLWVDQSGATTLGLTTLTDPFWTSTTVQQVCLAAIAASLIQTPTQPEEKESWFAVDSPIVPGQRLCISLISQRSCYPDGQVATMIAARAPC